MLRRDKEIAPAALWRTFRETMRKAIETITRRIYAQVIAATELEGIAMSAGEAEAVDAAFEVYVDGYVVSLATELERTTRDRMAAIEAAYRAGEIGLEDAEARMETLFDSERANLIAISETTRLFADVSQIVYQVTGVVDRVEWLTVRDFAVCPICEDFEGQIWPIDEAPQPPDDSHPGCRCRLAPVVREEEAAA